MPADADLLNESIIVLFPELHNWNFLLHLILDRINKKGLCFLINPAMKWDALQAELHLHVAGLLFRQDLVDLLRLYAAVLAVGGDTLPGGMGGDI